MAAHFADDSCSRCGGAGGCVGDSLLLRVGERNVVCVL
jgi:hypothetical protein